MRIGRIGRIEHIAGRLEQRLIVVGRVLAGQSQLPHGAILHGAHFCLVGIGHVVVAAQVQHGVRREIAQLARQRVAELLRLSARAVDRNHNVAQEAQSAVRVVFAADKSGAVSGRLARAIVHAGEGQYVGRPVHAPLPAVDFMDGFVVHDAHIRPHVFHALQTAHGLSRALHEIGRRGGHIADAAFNVKHSAFLLLPQKRQSPYCASWAESPDRDIRCADGTRRPAR